MSDNISERVQIPSSFSRDPSIPSNGDLSATVGIFSSISEMGNDSTQNSPAQNNPPAQILPSLLTPNEN